VNAGQSRLNVAYGAICIELFGAQAMGNSYALHRAQIAAQRYITSLTAYFEGAAPTPHTLACTFHAIGV